MAKIMFMHENALLMIVLNCLYHYGNELGSYTHTHGIIPYPTLVIKKKKIQYAPIFSNLINLAKPQQV